MVGEEIIGTELSFAINDRCRSVESKGDSGVGLATLDLFPESKDDPAQTVGPMLAEVKEKDKKRVILIKGRIEGKYLERDTQSLVN